MARKKSGKNKVNQGDAGISAGKARSSFGKGGKTASRKSGSKFGKGGRKK